MLSWPIYPTGKAHAEKVFTVTSQVAQKEIENLPSYIESCRIIYVPEIGYLLTVKQWQDNLTQDEIAFPGFEFKVGRIMFLSLILSGTVTQSQQLKIY